MLSLIRVWWYACQLGSLDRRVRCEAAEALGDLGNSRAVKSLIRAHGHDDNDVREAAAEALVKLGTPAVELLVKALFDGHGDVRRSAARLLGRLGDPRAVEPLIKALGDWAVCKAAAEALGKLGDPRAVGPLFKALCDRVGPERAAAAEALAQLGDPVWKQWFLGDDGDFVRLAQSQHPRAFELLSNALANGFDAAAAAQALGILGDLGAIEPLIKALGDGDEHVREAAAAALVELGEPDWRQWVHGDGGDFMRLAESQHPLAIEPLIKALGYGKNFCWAARALGKLCDPRAVEPLIKALGGCNNFARGPAASALGEIGDPRAVEPLIKVLMDGWACREAGEALSKLRDPRVVELLIETLDNVKGWDREKAVKAAEAGAGLLGKLGDPRAVQPLIKALSADDKRVGRAAAKALGELGDPRSVNRLIQALRAGNDLAAWALGILGDQSAVEPLIVALGDRNSGVRDYAAIALANLGNERSVEPLIEALRRPEWTIRAAAADALVRLGEPAVEPLIRALDGGSSAAAEALGKLGDPRSVEPLIRALGGGSSAAAEALGKLRDPRAVEPLVSALSHGGDDVRRGAAGALSCFAQSSPSSLRGRWQIIANMVGALHDDEVSHGDNGQWGDFGHTDMGIGVSFPAPPPGEDF